MIASQNNQKMNNLKDVRNERKYKKLVVTSQVYAPNEPRVIADEPMDDDDEEDQQTIKLMDKRSNQDMVF